MVNIQACPLSYHQSLLKCFLALAILGSVAHSDPDPNPTMSAVANATENSLEWEVATIEPFNSARKWSGVEFVEQGTFFFGAPDILLDGADNTALEKAQTEAEMGRRVLALCKSDRSLSQKIEGNVYPVCLILLDDTVREDAPEILKFFADQGVELKVISGDNTATVATVASKAGILNTSNSVDARTLDDDKKLSMAKAIDNENQNKCQFKEQQEYGMIYERKHTLPYKSNRKDSLKDEPFII